MLITVRRVHFNDALTMRQFARSPFTVAHPLYLALRDTAEREGMHLLPNLCLDACRIYTQEAQAQAHVWTLPIGVQQALEKYFKTGGGKSFDVLIPGEVWEVIVREVRKD